MSSFWVSPMISISCLSLVGTSIVNMNFYDQLDQYQIIYDYDIKIGYVNREGLQTFKPTLSTLTRIELYINQDGSAIDNFVVTIKKEGSKFDLASASVSPTLIPVFPDIGWIEFDFPDIQVTPEHTYQIFAKAENGVDTFEWGLSTMEDNYDRGSLFYKWEESDYLWETSSDGNDDWCFKTYGVDNLPPDKPDKPVGEESGKTGVSYIYSSSATDPNDDQIYYKFDWGDGTDSGWLGKYNSGETCEASHIWEVQGTYPVKVVAKDENGEESVWSDSLSVSLPRNKIANRPMIQVLQNHFNRLLLLRNFLYLLCFKS